MVFPPKSLNKLRVGLILGGLYLGQWAYLAQVGWPSGLWDMTYTHAEKALEVRPPYSEASVQRFRLAARQAEKLTPEDGRLARTYHDLGTLLWFTGRTSEGRVYLRRALEIFQRVDGRQSCWVGIVSERLGEIELRLGRNREAIDYLQRADGILVRTLGNLDPMALRAGTLVAVHTRSREKAKQVLDGYRRGPTPPDPITRLQLEQLIR